MNNNKSRVSCVNQPIMMPFNFLCGMEMNPFTYRNIIWDWNGTLLDDKWLCIEAISTLLTARNLPPIDAEVYSRIFRFPVRDYYASAGFDFTKEPFEVPALEFIDLYNERRQECPLQPGAMRLLRLFQDMGCSQYLLSASETGILEDMAAHYGITGFFKLIRGLDNHFAAGKAELGQQLLAASGAPAHSVLMIGDTCHDKEVADLLGVDCILLTNGHFPAGRLQGCGTRLINSLDELADGISGV
jgi:phosphoglycolate phosphatase